MGGGRGVCVVELFWLPWPLSRSPRRTCRLSCLAVSIRPLCSERKKSSGMEVAGRGDAARAVWSSYRCTRTCCSTRRATASNLLLHGPLTVVASSEGTRLCRLSSEVLRELCKWPNLISSDSACRRRPSRDLPIGDASQLFLLHRQRFLHLQDFPHRALRHQTSPSLLLRRLPRDVDRRSPRSLGKSLDDSELQLDCIGSWQSPLGFFFAARLVDGQQLRHRCFVSLRRRREGQMLERASNRLAMSASSSCDAVTHLPSAPVALYLRRGVSLVSLSLLPVKTHNSSPTVLSAPGGASGGLSSTTDLIASRAASGWKCGREGITR